MEKNVDVVIIGAGSAGLSALRQVKKMTDRFLLIDGGPLGTTCARVGCMPSKAIIHVANEFKRSRNLSKMGIFGSERLVCVIPEVMKHVRRLRDHFASGMVEVTRRLAGECLVEGRATILDVNRVRVGDVIYRTDKIIIATGSRPVIPAGWEEFAPLILNSDNFFEQEDFPAKVGVIGLGTIGLELGQTLSRLGVEVHGFNSVEKIGGLTDPDVNRAALEAIGSEFPIHLGKEARVEKDPQGVRILFDNKSLTVDKILVAAGVKPNLEGLGLENLPLPLSVNGLPSFDLHSMQAADLPVFIVGDVNGEYPLLHEALDEGFIAGLNSFSAAGPKRFCRRVPMKIVFSDPQIAVVGRSHEQLQGDSPVVGEADFKGQARARIEGNNRGLMRIYAERESMRLLGAEMAVPAGEHFAHLLALAIQHELTVADMLAMPFYHPTVEEGMRSALRDLMEKIPVSQKSRELSLCESCPEKPLA